MITAGWCEVRKPAVGINNQKGESHVVDNCCNTDHSVVAGTGEQLHDGRFNSHPAGHCHHCFDFRVHRGTQVLTVRTQIKNQTLEKQVNESKRV